jgi:cation diffusion facilitator family transporter
LSKALFAVDAKQQTLLAADAIQTTYDQTRQLSTFRTSGDDHAPPRRSNQRSCLPCTLPATFAAVRSAYRPDLARHRPGDPLHQRNRRRLTIVLLLNLALITCLVIVGLTAHSLGVLAAGLDYLADASAVGVSLLAIHLAQRPVTPRRPDGFPNATNYAALVNAGWLLLLNLGIIITAISRLASGVPEVHGLPVLIVSAIAAVVMLIGALILGGDLDDDEDEDLNLKAVLLDTAADAAAAAGVALAGGVILATRAWYWLDPAAASLIALVIAYHALALIRKVIAAIASTRQTTSTR